KRPRRKRQGTRLGASPFRGRVSFGRLADSLGAIVRSIRGFSPGRSKPARRIAANLRRAARLFGLELRQRMCGIAGIFHYSAPEKPVDRALLEQMTRKMAHRGPDGEGFHIDGPLGFGHRRLAIIDLSQTGSQPMCNEDRSIWINYNGEFYNHASQRARLASKHRFRGTSDTETFLHLFEERGVDCLEEIAGIFAVAFWDARR